MVSREKTHNGIFFLPQQTNIFIETYIKFIYSACNKDCRKVDQWYIKILYNFFFHISLHAFTCGLSFRPIGRVLNLYAI